MGIRPITEAKPYPRLAESHAHGGVLALIRTASPLYARAALGFRSVEIEHSDRLIEAFRAFFERKLRFIIAFRHPYGDEAQLMAYAILNLLDRESRRSANPLPRRPHAHFIHGYEVPLWSGPLERWLLPRVGAVPVFHTKFDAASIEEIRALMLNGEYPIALAPEGQVSYTSDGVPRLEAGVARIAQWCADDIARRKTGERVAILPVSIYHHWERDAENRLDRLIAELERQIGLSNPSAAPREARLHAAAGALLELAERWYARFYGYGGAHRQAAEPSGEDPLATATGALSPSATASAPLDRALRLLGVREAALAAAERGLRLRPEGDEIHRVYRIRQACWDRIYRQDIPDRSALPPVEAALADRIAGEAWLASRHMEFVDLSYYLDLDRLGADTLSRRDASSARTERQESRAHHHTPNLDALCETTQNLCDLASRLSGGNISHRPSIRGKKASIDVGEAIVLDPADAGMKTPRRAALDKIMADLATTYETSIHEHNLSIRSAR